MDLRRRLNGPHCVRSILLRRQSIFSRMDLLNSYLVVYILRVPIFWHYIVRKNSERVKYFRIVRACLITGLSEPQKNFFELPKNKTKFQL